MNDQEFGQMKEAVTTLKNEVTSMREDIGEIKDMLSRSKGAFSVLLWVGGIVAGVLGAIGSFISDLLSGK